MPLDFYTPMRLDEIDSPLERELKESFGIDVGTCMECGKCSGGCSNGHVFDFTPRKIVQLIRLGAEDTLMAMDALWICLACRLCVDRCPSGIDIPRIMDHLREKAHRKGVKPARPHVALFHELMLESIEKRGRVSEVPLMLRFNRETGQCMKDAGLGFRMFLRGKLRLFSPKVKKMGEIKRLFERIHGRSRIPG